MFNLKGRGSDTLVRLFRILFRVKLEYPVFSWQSNCCWILFHFFPVCLVPHLTSGDSSLLHRPHTIVSMLSIRIPGQQFLRGEGFYLTGFLGKN